LADRWKEELKSETLSPATRERAALRAEMLASSDEARAE
jgi:hypothetical protein